MREIPEHTILAYLDGTLSAEEREQFEAEIANSPALADIVSQNKQLQQKLSTYQTSQTDRALIEDLYQHPIKEKEEKIGATIRRIPTWQSLLLVAASLGILIWIFWPKAQIELRSSQQLFTQSFVPAPAPERMGKSDNEATNSLRQGHTAYALNKYPEAIAYYQQALPDSILRSEAAFFLAQSYLATQQYEQASAALKWVNNRQQEVAWFSALSALAQDDLSTSRNLLKPLADNPEYDYHFEAKELLDHISR